MPIDPNIALSVKPVQLNNPLEQFMQVQQIQQAQKQNRLADLMFGEKQRDADQNILINNAYKSATGADGAVDRPKLYGALAAGGAGAKLAGIQKSFAEADKATADLDQIKAKTGNLNAETASRQDDLREKKRQRAITDIAAFKTPQEALSSLAAHEQAGDLTPENAAAVRATIPTNAADFPKWQIGMLQRIMSANDIVKAGEENRHNKATESNAAGQLAVSQGQLGVAQGQLKVAQAREDRENTSARGVVVQSDAGPLVVDPRTGTGTAVTVGGKVVPAKGSGQAAKDAQSVISLLDMAEPLLDTATHSMVGEGYDRAAAMFGKSTQGAQAAAQLKALEGALIAKQPKMSGPQSDKDVLLYRQMAGQIGDPSVPVDTRKAALQTVRALNERYAGAPAPTPDAPKVRKYNPATGKIE